MSYYIYNQRAQRARTSLRYIALSVVIFSSASLGWALHMHQPAMQAAPQSTSATGKISTLATTINGRLLGESTTVKPPVPADWQATSVDSALLLELVNTIRTQNGRAQLRVNAQLTASAAAKCTDMVQKDYWSHNDPAGREPWHFIDEAGYRKLAAGENLAYGFSDANAVVEGWMNSPSHREAILNPLYTEVGFATCESQNFVQSGRQLIVVQHFGTPLP